MSQVQSPGLADLEKELGCSICTELLYQPLTLLDCLHTFCGSCLKEWFSAQGSRRHPRGASPRFTCPSCRAEVRGTRPNATVTTLLDMVLLAHPDQEKPAEEKEEIAQRYKHGDSVLPPPQEEDNESEDDEDDRRVLDEVRELSLRENRAQARREARRAGHGGDDGRSRRRRDEDPDRPRRPSRNASDAERSRRIEHQSSLRSLLSLSSETENMEEEIMRQIIEEGLLDDINLDNLGPSQEEELSERIADAYRRRHMHQQPRSRQGQRRRQSPDSSGHNRPRSQSARGSTNDVTTTARDNNNDRRPPISRPHLLDSTTSRPTGGHRRRNSEQARSSTQRSTSPIRVNQASTSDDTLRPAVRSSSDMTSERTRGNLDRSRADSSSRTRRATESDNGISEVWMGGGRERNSSRNISGQSASDSPNSVHSPPSNLSHSSAPSERPAPSLSSPLVPPRSERRPRSSRTNAPSSQNAQYLEPAISCDSCDKTDLQYELHKRCPTCKNGNYHLCLRCYRSGRGCLQWSGFEKSAQAAFERILASSNNRPLAVSDMGHLLVSQKYQKPRESSQIVTNGDRKLTNDNPARRLQAGLFCDICFSAANECFWKCSLCNQGDWGFCNRCVNQGRCCTDPLLPIRRVSGSPNSSATTSSTEVAAHPQSVSSKETFKILSFSTNCDICTYPIPASLTRFHCSQCNDGDYDVCTNCYRRLVMTSKISRDNGYNGWRLCLNGHRMIIVGFQDADDGQRRKIVQDLVGGHALKDEHMNRSPTSSPATSGPIASPELGSGHWSWKEGQGQERRKKASRLRSPTSSSSYSYTHSDGTTSNTGTPTSQYAPPLRRFPPDGGVGLIVHAKWPCYPEDGIEDELVFPRGAHIKEVENINDDWFWGCYAGRTGLFPGTLVTVVGEIK